jgi:hypothetical protein
MIRFLSAYAQPMIRLSPGSHVDSGNERLGIVEVCLSENTVYPGRINGVPKPKPMREGFSF